ncbi:MAG TPA: AMP-binding protein, partial [Chitinispirillaceae bacterium]|nr:AMP-binding protein [Chitinispirillaceae bacterium]
MNFIRYLLEKQPDQEKLFVLGDHGTLTYAELAGKLESLASILFNRYGSRKNILVMADNTPFFIISYLSIIYSGNIAIPVETRISKANLAEIETTSSLSGALVQEKYCQYFEDPPFEIMNETILHE